MCAQKLTQVSQLNLPHGNQRLKSGKKGKKVKTDTLRSIDKHSGKSVESVLKKKRKDLQKRQVFTLE